MNFAIYAGAMLFVHGTVFAASPSNTTSTAADTDSSPDVEETELNVIELNVEEPKEKAPSFVHQTEEGFFLGDTPLGETVAEIPCTAWTAQNVVAAKDSDLPLLLQRARDCQLASLKLHDGPEFVLADSATALAFVSNKSISIYAGGAAARWVSERKREEQFSDFVRKNSVALMFPNEFRLDSRLLFSGARYVWLENGEALAALDPETRALWEHIESDGPMVPLDDPAPGAKALAAAFGQADYVTRVTNTYPRWVDLGLVACRARGRAVAVAVTRGDDPSKRAAVENRARAELSKMVNGVEQSRSGRAVVTKTAGAVRGARVIKRFVRPDGFFALALELPLPPERAYLAREACEFSETLRTYETVRLVNVYGRPGFP